MEPQEALEIIKVLHEEGAISIGDYAIKTKQIVEYIERRPKHEGREKIKDNTKPVFRHRKSLTHEEFLFVQEFWQIDDLARTEEDLLKYLKTLHEHQKLVPVMIHIIGEEIERNRVGILREESIGASLLKNFWFHYEGSEYLKTVVKPLVKTVCEKTKSRPLEIDIIRLTDEAKVAANILTIKETIDKFLEKFFCSVSLFPRNIQVLFRNFYLVLMEMERFARKKLSESADCTEGAARLFGGFFLLRFICPAIVSPQKYGFVTAISPATQRTLIVVAKVIQGVGNQAEFGEPYMKPFNDFVTQKLPKMMTFITQLTGVDHS